ncbi:hypothetical protein ACFSQQ_11365 [Mesorhizobium kowhaii]
MIHAENERSTACTLRGDAYALTIQAHMTALDSVIVIYEPGYAPSAAQSVRQSSRLAKGGVSLRSEITTLMGGLNKRQTILEILRDARQPLSTAECSARFAEKLGLSEDDNRVSHIANRLAPVLDQLAKIGRVHSAGTIDGRKKLWQVAVR